MSTLKVNNLQVGQDGTAANNYTLYQPASPDGTVRLGYGVAGSVTDILTLKNSRLGIGTDNPQGKLVVSDGANGLEFNPNSNDAIVSYNRSTSAYAPNGLQGSTVQLRIGGVGTALHVHSDGNVGIGTDDPAALLHLESTAANAAKLRIGFDSPRYYDIFRGSTTNGGYLNFYGSQSTFVGYIFDGVDGERLRIDSAGKIGINETSPDSLLHLKNIAAAGIRAGIKLESSGTNNSANDTMGEILFAHNDSNDAGVSASIVCKAEDVAGNTYLQFNNGNPSALTERLRIDSTGNITLGYDGNSLYFQNGFNNSISRIQNGGGSNSSDLKFYTKNSGNESLKLKIESGGATTMHVNSASHETFRFSTQGVNEAKLMMKDASNNVDIQLNTGGSSWFQGGNVAIGHNSPDCIFHVRKDSTDTNFTNENTPSSESGVKIANLSTTVGSWTALTLSVSNGSSTQNGSIIAKSVSGGTRPEIHIGQRNGDTTESKITINSSGNVGINDSSPTRVLSVAGNMNLASGSRIESYSSGGNLIIQGGSTYPGGHLKMYGGTGDDKIEFCTSGGSASSTVRFRLESNGSIRLTPEGSTANPNARIDTSGDNLRLLTMKDGSGGCGFIIETQHGGALSEKFRITTDGNVSIGGKSNPAWNSTVDALTIGNAGVLYEDSYTSGTDNYLILGNNIFYTSSGNKYIKNDQASRLMMQAGTFYFDNAAAGTAGNAITFNTRLKITSTGQITHTGGHQANSGGANLVAGSYNRINASVSIPINSSKTLTFTGLQTGWMTIKIGGYGSAGHQAINCMYELGGYMTATYTYDVHVVRQWSRFGSISTSKNASNFTVTLPNTSTSYACWAWITIEGNGVNLAVNSN